MLINATIVFVVGVLVGLAIAFFSFRFFYRRKKYVKGGFIAFFAGIIFAMAIIMLNSTAYVISGKNVYTRYAVYGSPEYKMANGKTVKVKVKMQKCIVLNDSPAELVIEKVIYGYTTGTPRDILIAPYAAHAMEDAWNINYFFDHAPPSQITTKNRSSEMRLWLRTKTDYDRDHPFSIGSEKLEKLKELLQKRKAQLEEESEEETGEEEEIDEEETTE